MFSLSPSLVASIVIIHLLFITFSYLCSSDGIKVKGARKWGKEGYKKTNPVPLQKRFSSDYYDGVYYYSETSIYRIHGIFHETIISTLKILRDFNLTE